MTHKFEIYPEQLELLPNIERLDGGVSQIENGEVSAVG